MKSQTVFVFFLLVGISCAKQNLTITENRAIQDLSKATIDILSKFLMQDVKTLSIFKKSPSHTSFELINSILKDSNNNIAIEIFEFSKPLEEHLKKSPAKRGHCLFFAADFTEFELILEFLNPDVFRFQGYYLIVMLKLQETEVLQIFRNLWEKRILNANILAPSHPNDEVTLMSYNPFEFGSCGIPVVKKMAYLKQNFEYFPDKTRNLNKCPVKVVTQETGPFVVAKKSKQIDGIEGILLNFLAEKMNFTIELQVVEQKGVIFPNGSGSGAFDLLKNQKVEIGIGYYWVSQLMFKHFLPTQYFHMSKQRWIVPPGKTFTPIEKFFKPFKHELWDCIILVFVLSFVVIFALKFISPKVKDFVYGNNQNPILNIINIAFGNAVARTPSRNFARFLMMMFVIYCLIVRTAFGGSLFYFMTTTFRYPIIDTLEEMVDKNFKFYAIDSSRVYLQEHPKIIGR